VTIEEKLKESLLRRAFIYTKTLRERSSTSARPRTLRNRVRSYFQADQPAIFFGYDIKNARVVRQIADIEFIVTDTEAEALILEATLVKQASAAL